MDIETTPIIALKKNKKGEILFSFDVQRVQSKIKNLILKVFLVPAWHSYQYVLLSLEQTTGKRAGLSLVMALGLGFGIGITVFQRPTAVSATPTIVQSERANILPIRLISEELQLDHAIQSSSESFGRWSTENGLYYSTDSAGLGENSSVLIGGSPNSEGLKSLENAQLGQKITIEGSNHGRYEYTITEIKYVPANDVKTSLPTTEQALALYTFSSLRTEAIVVIARPAR